MALFQGGGFGGGPFGGGGFNGNPFSGFDADSMNEDMARQDGAGQAFDDPEKHSVSAVKERLKEVTKCLRELKKQGQGFGFGQFGPSIPVILKDQKIEGDTDTRTVKLLIAGPAQLCVAFKMWDKAIEYAKKNCPFSPSYMIKTITYTPHVQETGGHSDNPYHSDNWSVICTSAEQMSSLELFIGNKSMPDECFEGLLNGLMEAGKNSVGFIFNGSILSGLLNNDMKHTLKPFSILSGLSRLAEYPKYRELVDDQVVDYLISAYAKQLEADKEGELHSKQDDFIKKIQALPGFDKKLAPFFSQLNKIDFYQNGNLGESRQYKKLWRACTGEKVLIDMSDENMADWMFSAFGSVSQTDWDDQDDEEETDYSYQKMLLSLCDGVKWPEGMTVQKQLKRSFGKELLGTGDSELVRLALSKDLITKDQAKKLLGYAAEKRLSNVVPLLILKQSGEWTGGVCNV